MNWRALFFFSALIGSSWVPHVGWAQTCQSVHSDWAFSPSWARQQVRQILAHKYRWGQQDQAGEFSMSLKNPLSSMPSELPPLLRQLSQLGESEKKSWVREISKTEALSPADSAMKNLLLLSLSDSDAWYDLIRFFSREPKKIQWYASYFPFIASNLPKELTHLLLSEVGRRYMNLNLHLGSRDSSQALTAVGAADLLFKTLLRGDLLIQSEINAGKSPSQAFGLYLQNMQKWVFQEEFPLAFYKAEDIFQILRTVRKTLTSNQKLMALPGAERPRLLLSGRWLNGHGNVTDCELNIAIVNGKMPIAFPSQIEEALRAQLLPGSSASALKLNFNSDSPLSAADFNPIMIEVGLDTIDLLVFAPGDHSSFQRYRLEPTSLPTARFKSHLLFPPGPASEVQTVTVTAGKGADTLTLIQYDFEMSKRSGLPPSEIAALRTNFSKTIPETGEVGIFKILDEHWIDGKTNLVAAYVNLKKKLASGSKLTGQDILQFREKSYETRSIRNGTDLIAVETQYKGKFTSTLEFEIPPYVQSRLKKYGIAYTVQKGMTKIQYPEGSRIEALNQLAREINEMIDRNDPPERIVAFAVQDLLILHPFKDGNGRTARGVGQALYKQLTGKDLLFPSEFFREMEHSLDQLTQALLPEILFEVRNLRDAVEAAYRLDPQNLPTMVAPDLVRSEAPRTDAPFPAEFTDYQRNRVQYRSYPKEAREAAGFVYFGKPAGATLAEAEKTALSLMKFGRGSQDSNPHLDIRLHTLGTGSQSQALTKQSSGFFSTTLDWQVAARFATKTGTKYEFGAVAVIDPRQAEVLNLYQVGSNFPQEKEVAFGPRINPNRIQAVVILKNGKPVKVLRNPEYLPRK